jgi:hypothetical protein
MRHADIASETKQPENAATSWIASAYAQARFGGLQARHSSHSERRRVVALLFAMTMENVGSGD